jgi:homoserine dehydrogenase
VPSSVVWTENFDDLLGPEVDLIVEVIGGLDPAGRYHRAAIARRSRSSPPTSS